MRVILEVKTGPAEGRTVVLRKQQSIKVGRTEWADVALPGDGRAIAQAHFAAP